MSSWLDNLAKAAARHSAAKDPSVPAVDRTVSRRDALKRAGVVGAVLWTAPVVSSMTSPAYAATSPKANGTCKGHTDVKNGPCGGSGGCPKCGEGQRCFNDSDCLSGTCGRRSNGNGNGGPGVCAKGTPPAPCMENADCSSGVCSGMVNGQGTCAKGSGTCATGSDCFSGACNNGTCAKSAKGGTCSTSSDCASGLACRNGVCRGGGK